MKKRSKSKKLIAYHEAGHAVVSYYYDFPFRRISIKPSENCDGFVEHGDLAGALALRSPRQRPTTATGHLVRMCLAGSGAEYRLTDNEKLSWAGADSDRLATWNLVTTCYSDDRDKANAFVQKQMTQLMRLFYRADVWHAVEALADHLLKHQEVDGPTAISVIEKHVRRARAA